MPLTVITLKKVPASLRGDLTKWMQEIDTGVYVGNFSARIREKLWERILDTCKDGDACMCFHSNNEIGYKICLADTKREVIDLDGIPIVRQLSKVKTEKDKSGKKGFSNASKYRKSHKYLNYRKKSLDNREKYVSIDIETDGLDYLQNNIIEIGAYKEENEVPFTYQTLVKSEKTLNETIIKLTGIQDDDLKNGKTLEESLKELIKFIGDAKIIGYNISFDLKFINKALQELSYDIIRNEILDVMEYVKKDSKKLKSYKLNEVLKEYGITNAHPHRALEDAKSTYLLFKKLNENKKDLK